MTQMSQDFIDFIIKSPYICVVLVWIYHFIPSYSDNIEEIIVFFLPLLTVTLWPKKCAVFFRKVHGLLRRYSTAIE